MVRAMEMALRLHAKVVHTPSVREERNDFHFKIFTKYFLPEH